MQTKLLYRQDQYPIFQNRMYDSELEAKNCPKGDIELVENRVTGLVYNAAFDPSLMVYDSHYRNEQGISPVFQNHLDRVSEIVVQHFGYGSIVEVGCGKGLFLEMLLEKGCDITGFDPTYEGENQKIMKHYFLPDVGIQANGLVLRHVLEHIQDPYSFLQQLKEANGGSGKIYIEVPCLDWICKHHAWFDIFYEHVNYFRINDFYRMFGNVHSSGHLFGGQYLYVVAELSSLREPKFDSSNSAQFPVGFLVNLNKRVLPTLGEVAIWGGASRGVIYALHSERLDRPVSLAIDINPAKQGKYLPATGLLVHSPTEAFKKIHPGSTILVMNSNYLEEIKSMSNNQFTYKGIDHE